MPPMRKTVPAAVVAATATMHKAAVSAHKRQFPRTAPLEWRTISLRSARESRDKSGRTAA
jgi:hypothetical protein